MSWIQGFLYLGDLQNYPQPRGGHLVAQVQELKCRRKKKKKVKLCKESKNQKEHDVPRLKEATT